MKKIISLLTIIVMIFLATTVAYADLQPLTIETNRAGETVGINPSIGDSFDGGVLYHNGSFSVEIYENCQTYVETLLSDSDKHVTLPLAYGDKVINTWNYIGRDDTTFKMGYTFSETVYPFPINWPEYINLLAKAKVEQEAIDKLLAKGMTSKEVNALKAEGKLLEEANKE